MVDLGYHTFFLSRFLTTIFLFNEAILYYNEKIAEFILSADEDLGMIKILCKSNVLKIDHRKEQGNNNETRRLFIMGRVFHGRCDVSSDEK